VGDDAADQHPGSVCQPCRSAALGSAGPPDEWRTALPASPLAQVERGRPTSGEPLGLRVVAGSGGCLRLIADDVERAGELALAALHAAW